MTSSLKCVNVVGNGIYKNKCPPSNKPNQVYCNTDSGKCYAETKEEKPWGYEKYRQKNHDAIFDKALKLFGARSDVHKHQNVLQRASTSLSNGEPTVSKTTLQRKSPESVRQIARMVGVLKQDDKRTKDQLIWAILAKQESNRTLAERQALLLTEPTPSAPSVPSVPSVPSAPSAPSVASVASVASVPAVIQQPDVVINLSNQLTENELDDFEYEDELNYGKDFHRQEAVGEFSLIIDPNVPDYKIRDYLPIKLSDLKREMWEIFRTTIVV